MKKSNEVHKQNVYKEMIYLFCCRNHNPFAINVTYHINKTILYTAICKAHYQKL